MLDRAGFLAFLCYEAMHGSKYDFTGGKYTSKPHDNLRHT